MGEDELQETVRECREREQTVRVVGSSHSRTPVARTDGILVSLEEMTGVVECDEKAQVDTNAVQSTTISRLQKSKRGGSGNER